MGGCHTKDSKSSDPTPLKQNKPTGKMFPRHLYPLKGEWEQDIKRLHDKMYEDTPEFSFEDVAPLTKEGLAEYKNMCMYYYTELN